MPAQRRAPGKLRGRFAVQSCKQAIHVYELCILRAAEEWVPEEQFYTQRRERFYSVKL